MQFIHLLVILVLAAIVGQADVFNPRITSQHSPPNQTVLEKYRYSRNYTVHLSPETQTKPIPPHFNSTTPLSTVLCTFILADLTADIYYHSVEPLLERVGHFVNLTSPTTTVDGCRTPSLAEATVSYLKPMLETFIYPTKLCQYLISVYRAHDFPLGSSISDQLWNSPELPLAKMLNISLYQGLNLDQITLDHFTALGTLKEDEEVLAPTVNANPKTHWWIVTFAQHMLVFSIAIMIGLICILHLCAHTGRLSLVLQLSARMIAWLGLATPPSRQEPEAIAIA